MDELSLKLKNSVIEFLTKNKENLDQPYLTRGDKQYTKRQLADEIQNETEFGVKLLADMLILAIDLTARQKI
ncbi:MAG TPA: hypothetical protein VK172_10305 [Lentimicrobium sp.]|nr:hypothetical protein [Lentimicrobium sp.]